MCYVVISCAESGEHLQNSEADDFSGLVGGNPCCDVVGIWRQPEHRPGLRRRFYFRPGRRAQSVVHDTIRVGVHLRLSKLFRPS